MADEYTANRYSVLIDCFIVLPTTEVISPEDLLVAQRLHPSPTMRYFALTSQKVARLPANLREHPEESNVKRLVRE